MTCSKWNSKCILLLNECAEVAYHSIYQADFHTDYTKNNALAEAEKEIKGLTLRRYKWG